MELWIARDNDGDLWIFERKPYLYEGEWVCEGARNCHCEFDFFPEITFENSPLKMILELKKI